MGLREQATLDAQAIIENTDDFGAPVILTDPNDQTYEFVGLPNDIGVSVDPETGQAVSERRATVAFSMRSLEALELELPVGKTTGKPWRARFNDARGRATTWKVVETQPDRTLGVIVCFLEIWKTL
jgi:hypothetical protein